METGHVYTVRRFRPLLAIALLSVLLPAPTHAIANPNSVATVSRNRTEDNAALDQQAINREIERFRGSAVSLRQAAAVAEALHPGSTTADISFDGTAAAPVYRVKTLHNDRIWQDVVDATTGEVVGSGAALPLTELDADDRSNLAALKGLRHRLADAVRVAEQAASGKAISGGVIRERGRLNFSIVVVSGSDLKEVILEPPGARRR